MKNIQKSGGKFVIVSGRSKTSIDKVLEKYNINYDYMILNNGAIIFDNDGCIISEKFIDPYISNNIVKHLKSKSDIEVLFYDENDKVAYNGQKLLKIRIKTLNRLETEKIESEINYLFGDKVVAHANFEVNYCDYINYEHVDIVSIEAGKEKGIARLIKMLDIKKEEVVTVGDGKNDIEMIKQYNGYAMVTAEEDVKKVASKVFENILEVFEYIK